MKKPKGMTAGVRVHHADGTTQIFPVMGVGTISVGMRRFLLDRFEDVSGVSGTGFVAEGVQFTDGTVVLRWTVEYQSTAIYSSMDDLMAIHGHNGSTHVNWVDDG